MTKLPRIDKNIQKRFILSFLALILVFAVFFWFFIDTQRRTVEKHHISYIEKADTIISSTLKQARLNDYIVAREIAESLKTGGKDEVIETLVRIEEREGRVGVLLDSDVLLVLDQEGRIIARGELVKEKRIELLQEGDIRDGWVPPLAFEQALAKALNGSVDVRKIIYDRNFLRREGYDRFGFMGMGLTIITPITNKEDGNQIGVLIRISFVNENKELIEAIEGVTGVAFTAILPNGDVVGSFFTPESAEKIKPNRAIIAAAEKRREKIIRKELEKTTESFILEEHTIERIKMTHRDGTSANYRIVYWLELDSDGNFASLRGIGKEIEDHLGHQRFLIQLILIVLASLLIIFGFFYFLIQKTLIDPITFFIKGLKEKKENKRMVILKHYQEFKELEDAFNSSFDQIKDARDVLEIKVEARTMELKELSESLEEQVKARTIELENLSKSLEGQVKARTIELENLSKSLEGQVKERTKEIQEQVMELEKFNKLAVDRELRMIELKKELEELKKRIKEQE